MTETENLCAWCGKPGWDGIEIAMLDVDLPKPGYAVRIHVYDMCDGTVNGHPVNLCLGCFATMRNAVRTQLNAICP